jgi:O-antigen/teichoic acid export membrane protein
MTCDELKASGMSKYEEDLTKLAKGGSLSAAGDFFMAFTRMLIGVFITHLFTSPESFGLYELAFRIIVFLQVFAVPGTNLGIKRFLPIYRADRNAPALKGLLLFCLRLHTILSSVVFVLAAVFADWIARILNQPEAAPYIRILALAIPFYSLTMTVVSSLTALKRMRYEILIQKFFVPGMRLLILLGFMFVGNLRIRELAVVWSFPVTFAFGCAFGFYFFFKHFKLLRDRLVKPVYERWRLVKFSLPLAAMTPLSRLMNHVGTFIIALYATEFDLGQYGLVAGRLATFLIVPLQSAIIVFGPFISELHHLGRGDELAKHYKFISKWIFALSFFVFLAFVVLSKPILTVFGSDYAGLKTRWTLGIVSLGQLLGASVGPVGMLVAMTGRPRLNLYNTALLFVVNTGLCVVLVRLDGPLGGIVGAGLALAISIVGIKFLYLSQVYKYLGMHPFSRSYLKPLLAGAISSAIVFGLIQATGFAARWSVMQPEGWEYLWLAAQVLAFAGLLGVLYGVFIYLLGLDDEDKFILRKIFTKLGYGQPGSKEDTGPFPPE